MAGGGYAAGGASLLDEMDFTAANLRDGGKGAVPGEVMIHELVHQWWGLGNMFEMCIRDRYFSVSFVFNSRSEKDAVAVGLYQNPNRSPAERIRFEKEEQGGGRMMSFLPQA